MRGFMLLAACLAGGASAALAQAPSASPPLSSISLPGELERVLRDYERAWQAGNGAALAALFTADGFVPTRTGWVRGAAAITQTYSNASGPLRLRALAFATADTVGYIVGTFGYGTAPGATDPGKFLLALRRTPGGPWLIAADLDH